MHGGNRRQVAILAGAYQRHRRTLASRHVHRDFVQGHRRKAETLVKGGADFGEQPGDQRAFLARLLQDLLDQPRGMAGAAVRGRSQHGADAAHPSVAAVHADRMAVPLERRHVGTRVVHQREALQVLAAPRCAQLAAAPLRIRLARQPVVPDRKGIVEHPLDERSIGLHHAHVIDDFTV